MLFSLSTKSPYFYGAPASASAPAPAPAPQARSEAETKLDRFQCLLNGGEDRQQTAESMAEELFDIIQFCCAKYSAEWNSENLFTAENQDKFLSFVNALKKGTPSKLIVAYIQQHHQREQLSHHQFLQKVNLDENSIWYHLGFGTLYREIKDKLRHGLIKFEKENGKSFSFIHYFTLYPLSLTMVYILRQRKINLLLIAPSKTSTLLHQSTIRAHSRLPLSIFTPRASQYQVIIMLSVITMPT